MNKTFLLPMFLIIGTMISGSIAQTVSLPYQMSFEEADSVELRNWVLNPGTAAANCEDQWVIGRALHSAGHQSLYISNNNGTDAQFGSHPNVQYAYRDFDLPAGRYDFTFDWLCLGGATSSLYVGWAEASDFPALNARATSGVLPNTIKARMCTNFSDMKNADTWQHADTTIQTAGATMRLVFAWVSRNTDSTLSTIGACIDNIALTSTNCKRPYDIDVEVISCDSVLVTWSGTSGSYEFAYRNVESDVWYTRRNIPGSGTKGQIYLSDMYESSYDFRVRGICTLDTSLWVDYLDYAVYCPEKHCLDFTDLYADNVVCTYGKTEFIEGHLYNDSANRAHAYDNIGVVDYGSDSKSSRHTVNRDPTAFDPKVGEDLPVIPQGNSASIRLGNWDFFNDAESIQYEFLLDSAFAVLVLQYAIVCEYGLIGHEPESLARLVVEILDGNGTLKDTINGLKDFYAVNADGVEWIAIGSDQIIYKPWNVLQFNLFDMGFIEGDIVKIRLTTYDCFRGAHYGYAYFTIHCTGADAPQPVTSIESPQADIDMPRKIFHNGQIYILRDGKAYDLTGKEL